MTLTFDASNDWQVWDNLEAVTYTDHRNTGDFPYAVANAMRRQPTYKELMASNGAYTGQDLIWEVPANQLVENADANVQVPQPKPGDRITDGSGVSWTILEAAFATVQSVWTLTTRNLVLAYGLRDLITIESSAVAYDADQAAARSWKALYAKLACRVQPVAETVQEARDIRGRQIEFVIVLSQQVVIDVRESRVNWTDVYGQIGAKGTQYYLDITRYHDSFRIDELPKIEAILKV